VTHRPSLFVLLIAYVSLTAGFQRATKRYHLRGQVLASDVAAEEITVKHKDIPGLMPAMIMPFKIKDPAAMRKIEIGDKITADVIVANHGSDYWLENIRITSKRGRKTVTEPAAPRQLAIGEHVPSLPLVNQDGKTIHLDDFKGKGVLLTFIYTRCPMPNFCPRLSSQFARIHEDLAKTPDLYRKTHMLTVSFDPKYDTAPVLRRYGLAYLDNDASGFSQWDFASAAPNDMRRLADAFGLVYFEQDNQIAHSMDIVLISSKGTVVKYWSTEWTTAELENALREQTTELASASRRIPDDRRSR